MIVALLSVSDGITQTAAGFVHLGGSDLGVFQAGVSDPTVSILPTSQVARLERNPDVARATPLLLIVGKVRHAPSAFVFGARPRRVLRAAAGVRHRRLPWPRRDRDRVRPRRDPPPRRGRLAGRRRSPPHGLRRLPLGDHLRGRGRRAAARGRPGARGRAARDHVDRRRADAQRERGGRAVLDHAAVPGTRS